MSEETPAPNQIQEKLNPKLNSEPRFFLTSVPVAGVRGWPNTLFSLTRFEVQTWQRLAFLSSLPCGGELTRNGYDGLDMTQPSKYLSLLLIRPAEETAWNFSIFRKTIMVFLAQIEPRKLGWGHFGSQAGFCGK